MKDPNGREKCVSCQLCEFVCPPKAIRITPGSVPEDESDREHVEKAPEEFEINMLRCIYCGYCKVCPEEAIFLQDEYSTSGYSREEMINNKAKLYELEAHFLDPHYKWDKKKDAEVQETLTELFFWLRICY